MPGCIKKARVPEDHLVYHDLPKLKDQTPEPTSAPSSEAPPSNVLTPHLEAPLAEVPLAIETGGAAIGADAV